MSAQLLGTMLGIVAAALTSLSYIPQAKKAFTRGATKDLSLKMLLALMTGLLLWVIYGLLHGDFVIVLANATGAGLVGVVLGCKLRDLKASH